MPVPTTPLPPATSAPAAVSPPAQRLAAAPAAVSRFGEISPAFAAAFGASVGVGLLLGARNAEARAFSGRAHSPGGPVRRTVLPAEIATGRALPPSRVNTALDIAPGRGCPSHVR